MYKQIAVTIALVLTAAVTSWSQTTQARREKATKTNTEQEARRADDKDLVKKERKMKTWKQQQQLEKRYAKKNGKLKKGDRRTRPARPAMGTARSPQPKATPTKKAGGLTMTKKSSAKPGLTKTREGGIVRTDRNEARRAPVVQRAPRPTRQPAVVTPKPARTAKATKMETEKTSKMQPAQPRQVAPAKTGKLSSTKNGKLGTTAPTTKKVGGLKVTKKNTTQPAPAKVGGIKVKKAAPATEPAPAESTGTKPTPKIIPGAPKQ